MNSVVAIFAFVFIISISNKNAHAAPSSPHEAIRDKRGLYQYEVPNLTLHPSISQANRDFFYGNGITSSPAPFHHPPPPPQLPTAYNQYNSFEVNNLPTINHYYVNGRAVKPYEVEEENDVGDNSFFLKTNMIARSRESLNKLELILKDPFYADKLTGQFVSASGSYDPYLLQINRPPTPVQFPRRLPITLAQRPGVRPGPRPVYSQNHGPVALGSGSLGYIRLMDGNVFIGSGSLGYTNEQQFTDTVHRAQKPPQFQLLPSAVTFGRND